MRLQLSIALLFCAVASAAGNAVPSIEESLGMKSVAGAQISPDGRYVAYTVQQANWDENDFYTQRLVQQIHLGEE
jgi:Tol biopolymer transport system component